MLELIVFVCGAAVMVLEMVGARIVAPYFGSSIVVWTALIGTVLASLSLGYWWGGRIADRNPRLITLGRIILFAGLCIGLVAVAKSMILDFWGLDSTPIYFAVTAINLVLFAPASILLGMISPYAVRLKMVAVERAGSTAGRLYALSTLGSIVGTFFAGFFLIAVMGSTSILILLAVVLIVLSLGASMADRGTKVAALVVIVLLGLGLNAYAGYLQNGGFHDLDTHYSRVFIYKSEDGASGRPTRAMATTPRFTQSAMYLDEPTGLVLKYTRFFKAAWSFNPSARRCLVLGGGGYSFPKYALVAHPELHVEVVELDPGVTHLARLFFGLEDHPRMRIHHEDGRTFINRSRDTFDVILGDVFNSQYSVPFHLTTVETVRRLHDMLEEDGVVIMNTITAIEGPGGRFLRAQFLTFAEVFPHVHLYPLQHPEDGQAVQNVMIVASKKALPLDAASPDPDVRMFLGHRWTRPIPSDVPILTDEFAPVENIMASNW
ncbi:MAG: fused MFS/spermidine synthase [Syntrophobacteraceae bacterium]|jgi:spermidine synthase|nr:fused MFS/spermidine synthase [Syntrophobacteraceae bacterium]